MTRQHIFLLALLLMPVGAVAGDPPSMHFTGNPAVDFFSGQTLASQHAATLPATKMFQEESMTQDKSPMLAGLMSLVVPGAGQAYSENYIKGALFFAVEAASWYIAYSYNKKGRKATVDFENFANSHWSAVRYINWTLDNIGVLSNGNLARTQFEDNVYNSDYDPDDPLSCKPPFRCVEWAAMNDMERQIGSNAPAGGNAYVHSLPLYAEQQYYELIGKYEQFSRGWEDADQSAVTLSDLPLKNNSQMFSDYSRMRANANGYYEVASTWVSVAVLNHIVSALDAYWSATKFNKALHAEVNMKLQPTPFGVVPITEARIRYEF